MNSEQVFFHDTRTITTPNVSITLEINALRMVSIDGGESSWHGLLKPQVTTPIDLCLSAGNTLPLVSSNGRFPSNDVRLTPGSSSNVRLVVLSTQWRQVRSTVFTSGPFWTPPPPPSSSGGDRQTPPPDCRPLFWRSRNEPLWRTQVARAEHHGPVLITPLILSDGRARMGRSRGTWPWLMARTRRACPKNCCLRLYRLLRDRLAGYRQTDEGYRQQVRQRPTPPTGAKFMARSMDCAIFYSYFIYE